MQSLHNLSAKTDKKSKRVGRGNASSGTYSGRGMKGQKARSGASGMLRRASRDWVQKLPKMKGFKSRTPQPAWIDVAVLAKKAADMNVITPGLLKKSGLVDTIQGGVKIIGKGPITASLHIKGCYLSQSAKQAIITAGGSVTDEKFRPRSPHAPAKEETTKKSSQEVDASTK